MNIEPTNKAITTYEVTFRTTKRERAQWLRWLREEWDTYADPKFDLHRPTHDRSMAEEGIEDGSWWFLQVFQYVRRAQLLGVDNYRGRQQLVKCLAALTGCIESMIRVYGDLPAPGQTSGEVIEDWQSTV